MAKTVFNFSYTTNQIEVVEEKVETEVSGSLIEAFDKKIACFTNVVPSVKEVAEQIDGIREDTYDPTGETSGHLHQRLDAREKPLQQKSVIHSPTVSNKPAVRARIIHPKTGKLHTILPASHPDVSKFQKQGFKVNIESVVYDQTGNEIVEEIKSVNGKYALPKLPKAEKGNFGDILKTTEKITPASASDLIKSMASKIAFNDRSKEDTEDSADATHGPLINQQNSIVGTPHALSVKLVPSKGYTVVDQSGNVVIGKDGKELSGFHKQSAAKFALRGYERNESVAVYSMSLSQLKEAVSDHIDASTLDWTIEIVNENNVHSFYILDEADVIAEGTSLTLNGAAKCALRKAQQLESYVLGKLDQPSRVLDIIKSTVTK
jgi:hypothetical protein